MIHVKLTQNVGNWLAGTELGFIDLTHADAVLGAGTYVQTYPVTPPTQAELDAATANAIAYNKAHRYILGSEFDNATATLTPGPGQIVVGGASGPVRVAQVRPNTFVLMGDSITLASWGPGPYTTASTAILTNAAGYHAVANVLLDHRMDVLSNAGKGGDTTTGMLARFDAEVVALRPAWVTIQGGTNDAPQGVSAATTIANLTAMYTKARDAGIRVVAIPAPPRTGLTTGQMDTLLAVNSWVRLWAEDDPWLVLADVGQAIADPAQRWAPLAGLTSDGVHPTAAGAGPMAQVLAAALDPILPKVSPFVLGAGAGVGENLLNQGSMTGTGTAAPTGWTVNGVPTISYVPRTDGIAGSWAQFVVANNSAPYLQQTVSLGVALAVGDRVEFWVEFQVENLDTAPAAASQGFYARTRQWNGSTFIDEYADLWRNNGIDPNFRYPGASGVFRTVPHTITAGTSSLACIIQLNGGGTYRIGRVLARNLTALGLA